MAKGAGALRQGDTENRREVARAKRWSRADPPPAEPRGKAGIEAAWPPRWTPHFRTGLPTDDGCEFPLTCLGLLDGEYHFLDSGGLYRAETAGFFTHAGLQDIFGDCPNYPEWCCPRFAKTKRGEKPRIESFKDDAVRKLIFKACRRGEFKSIDMLRGRGAWRLQGGQLVYHAGDEIWIAENGQLRDVEPGMIGQHLYPRLPELPAPWGEAITPENNPARALLETFRKWSWERPDIDPVLLLGWIGVAYLGGALDWRPALFLIGGHGTGKSTLQDGVKAIFGDALFASSETTAAGIYQRMRQDARPVAIDELEADDDNRRQNAVVKLARSASSGAMGYRGGADGRGTEFQMRSAFLFSAINSPLQSAQDLSRVAVLRLRSLNPDQPAPPPIDTDTTGRMVLAQLMRNFYRWDETLAQYKAALAAGGHTNRGQATYGALLAAADLMLGPELAQELKVETADLAWWSDNLGAADLPEVEDAKQNWRACIEHLLTARVEPWRNGVRNTIGKLLDDLRAGSMPEADAVRDLALTGLGLVKPGIVNKADEGWVLAVPNQSQLVADLFAGTQWAGSYGAGGPWKDALRQGVEHKVVSTDKTANRVRINGVQCRCSLIRLSHFENAPER